MAAAARTTDRRHPVLLDRRRPVLFAGAGSAVAGALAPRPEAASLESLITPSPSDEAPAGQVLLAADAVQGLGRNRICPEAPTSRPGRRLRTRRGRLLNLSLPARCPDGQGRTACHPGTKDRIAMTRVICRMSRPIAGSGSISKDSGRQRPYCRSRAAAQPLPPCHLPLPSAVTMAYRIASAACPPPRSSACCLPGRLAGSQGGAISVPSAHAATMRAVAGEPARQRNDLDHQGDAGACDGDNQQHPHRG